MPLNVEAGGLLWVQGWPVVYSKTMAQKLVMTTLKKLRSFLWEAGSICTLATVSVCMFCPPGAVLRGTPLLQIF